jgi:hypothetical protein
VWSLTSNDKVVKSCGEPFSGIADLKTFFGVVLSPSCPDLSGTSGDRHRARGLAWLTDHFNFDDALVSRDVSLPLRDCNLKSNNLSALESFLFVGDDGFKNLAPELKRKIRLLRSRPELKLPRQ